MFYRKGCIIFFFLVITKTSSQEISGIVLDSLTQQPISFANIISNFNKNTITNEEGRFRLFKEIPFTNRDSVYVSSIGYNSITILATNLINESKIVLSPKIIELETVVVTNREKLTAIEIIDKVKENVKNVFEFDYKNKKIFRRRIIMSDFDKAKIDIKKSSIKEFDQIFMDSITSTIPKKNNFYIESLYDFFGNRDPDNQKVNILKSAELINKDNEISFKTIQSKIQPIVDIKVKRDSYFKFKSGIIPIDIDREGLDFMSIDSTDNSQLEKIKNNKLNERKDFNLNNRNYIKDISNSYIDYKNKEFKYEVFKKSRKFNFKISEFSYLGYEPVYIIEYYPKSTRGKYKGRLFIHADDFALIRIDNQNIRLLRNLNFLGVYFRLNKRLYKRIFKKNENNKYDLYFAENYYESSFGLNRPLKIIEKNKNVRGRRKQNQLKMQITFTGNNKVKTEVIFIESDILKVDDYNKIKEIDSELPVKLMEYDPNFWSGYNILEPQQILKEFKVENVN
tara:strand:- start:8042 stop:9568 length:1527 start_codon:yes stop_codon:yes gene_type:complete